jgi:hypothetical protein
MESPSSHVDGRHLYKEPGNPGNEGRCSRHTSGVRFCFVWSPRGTGLLREWNPEPFSESGVLGAVRAHEAMERRGRLKEGSPAEPLRKGVA